MRVDDEVDAADVERLLAQRQETRIEIGHRSPSTSNSATMTGATVGGDGTR